VRYRIRHRTSYAYARPVHESFNEIRLEPMACAEQTPLDFELAIEPPGTVITFRDYYGNSVHNFGIPYLHDRLEIVATSDVVTHAGEHEPLAGPGAGEDDISRPLAELADDDAVSDELAEFLGPSPYVPLDDATAGIARELVAAGEAESALAFLHRASGDVQARLTYRVGATTVETSVAEALEGGSGVCQDFAHVLVSLCRHAGMPARYVSGYLGSVPEATASHAWAEAFVPPYGWIGIDPTAGRVCTGAYVKVGVGRDYADVSVLRGTYQGRVGAELEVHVESEAVDASDAIELLRRRPGARGGPLVAIQNLGAMRQFRRRPLLRQSMGGMTQTLVFDESLPPRRQPVSDDDVPMQQPRQQQQCERRPP
jgi:transglutaminase-like putative cysteine protease